MSGTKATFAKSAAVTAGFAAGLFDPSKTVTGGSTTVELDTTLAELDATLNMVLLLIYMRFS
jgi:hypothetical protein